MTKLKGGQVPDLDTSQKLLNAAKVQALGTFEDAMKKNADNFADSVKSAAKNAASNVTKNRVEIAMTFIKPIFGAIWKIVITLLRDLSPYIAFAIVIIVLIMLFRGATSSGSNTGGTSQDNSAWGKIKSALEPNYQIRAFFSGLNFTRKDPYIPRRMIQSGRCDNYEWLETGGDGQDGLCVKTYKPETIRWVLDTDRMPELSKMPEDIAIRLKSGGEMLQVFIPWEQEGTFYVPQCDQAYYVSTDDNGKEVHIPATKLLEDNGLTCKRKEYTSKKYTTYRYRPVNAKDKTQFATQENPMC